MHKIISQKKRKIFILLLGILLVISTFFLTFSGCSAKEQERIKIKVAVLPYIPYGTFFIAEEEGYFAEQNLEVEFVKFNTITQAIPLLAQGELDATAGPFSASLVNAIANSANLKIVAGRDSTFSYGLGTQLMVDKALYDSGELDELVEIKGKKVAVPSIGALMDFCLSETLNQVGLTLNDVELVKLSPQDSIAALGNHAIAGSILGKIQSNQAMKMGYAVPIPPIDLVLPDFQEGWVFFGPNLLNKPEIGEKFLIAYLKGCAAYAQGKTDRNIEIISQYTGYDRELLLETEWNPVVTDGRIIINDIMTFQQWLFDIELIDAQLSPSDMIDDTLLKNALKTME